MTFPPNPPLEPLSALVGTWRTTGRHPMLPGVTLRGRASFEWLEGRAFLLMRTETDHPRVPAGIAVFGSDDAAGRLFMLYYDERGVSRKYDVTFANGVLSWSRDDPKFSQRFAIALQDGSSMSGRGSMSRDGHPWEDDLSLDYVREG